MATRGHAAPKSVMETIHRKLKARERQRTPRWAALIKDGIFHPGFYGTQPEKVLRKTAEHKST